jgi:ketosteroid isomerase-like protein
MWRGMVSQSAWQARNVWVDNNTIIIEWTGQVTFAATGKQGQLNEVAIHEIENGKIVRERFYYDRSALQP